VVGTPVCAEVGLPPRYAAPPSFDYLMLICQPGDVKELTVGACVAAEVALKAAAQHLLDRRMPAISGGVLSDVQLGNVRHLEEGSIGIVARRKLFVPDGAGLPDSQKLRDQETPKPAARLKFPGFISRKSDSFFDNQLCIVTD
jgi:hypothetical protein